MQAWKTYKKEDVLPDVPEEGTYLARVSKVTGKETAKGDEMISLKFVEHETGKHLCWDNLVLSDNGLPFAIRKLVELGAARDAGDHYEIVGPEHIEDMTVYLTLVHDEYQGEKKAVPEFSSSNHGYRSVDKGEPEVGPGGLPPMPPPAAGAAAEENLEEVF